MYNFIIRNSKTNFILLIIFTSFVAVIETLTTVLISLTISNLFGKNSDSISSFEYSKINLIYLVVLYLIASSIQLYYLNKFVFKNAFSYGDFILEKWIQSKVDSTKNIEDFVNLYTSELYRVSDKVLNGFFIIFSKSLILLILFTAGVYISGLKFLAVISLFFINYLLIVFFTKNLADKIGKNVSLFNKQRIDQLVAIFRLRTTIKIFEIEQLILEKFNKNSDKIIGVRVSNNILSSLPRIIIDTFLFSLMLFSIYAISIGIITVAELAFLSIISLKSIPILNQIYFAFSEYRNNSNSVLLLEQEYKKFNIKHNTKHDSYQYLVEFSDVNVKYEITNVKLPDLKINLRGDYLIIGPSGSGKSTLIKLILGQHLVFDGEIIYNKNYSNIKFSFCDQESVLFNDSLLFNITFKNSLDQVNIKRLKEVFDICNLRDVLEDFQKITDFKIEEMGKSLSGGQIQRVNIARAIYKDSDVYILDEITSSLDTKLQLNIYKSLILYLKDKLVIHIAHRNEIIELFNQNQIIKLNI